MKTSNNKLVLSYLLPILCSIALGGVETANAEPGRCVPVLRSTALGGVETANAEPGSRRKCLPVLRSIALWGVSIAKAVPGNGFYLGAGIGAGSNDGSSFGFTRFLKGHGRKIAHDITGPTLFLPIMGQIGYKVVYNNFVMPIEISGGVGIAGASTPSASMNPSWNLGLHFLPGAYITEKLSIHMLLGADVLNLQTKLHNTSRRGGSNVHVANETAPQSAWLIGGTLGAAIMWQFAKCASVRFSYAFTKYFPSDKTLFTATASDTTIQTFSPVMVGDIWTTNFMSQRFLASLQFYPIL